MATLTHNNMLYIPRVVGIGVSTGVGVVVNFSVGVGGAVKQNKQLFCYVSVDYLSLCKTIIMMMTTTAITRNYSEPAKYILQDVRVNDGVGMLVSKALFSLGPDNLQLHSFLGLGTLFGAGRPNDMLSLNDVHQ